MSFPEVKVLCIEDDPDDYELIGIDLGAEAAIRFELDRVECLSDGLKLLQQVKFHVILLDLTLPDAKDWRH